MRVSTPGVVTPRLPDAEAEARLEGAGFTALVPYPGAHEPWLVRCHTAGHEVQVKLARVVRDRGCPGCARNKRLTDGEARALMRVAGFEPLGPYPGLHKPWPSRCHAAGHEVAPHLNNVRLGSGCWGCSPTRRVTVEIAMEAIVAVGFEAFEPYPGGAKKPWRVRCLKAGHEVSTTATKVQQGYGCRECSPTRRYRDDEAVEIMRAAGIEPIGSYPGARTPWPSVCHAAGHEVAPLLVSVRRGAGCAKCAPNAPIDPVRAVEVMRAAGYEPLGPFPGAGEPWPSICVAGHETAPRYTHVQGGTRCLVCAGKARYTDAQARLIMNAARFDPQTPYMGTDEPWPSLCIAGGTG